MCVDGDTYNNTISAASGGKRMVIGVSNICLVAYGSL